MKRKHTKLPLRTETIRRLGSLDLPRVGGGQPLPTTYSRAYPGCDNPTVPYYCASDPNYCAPGSGAC